MAWPKNVASKIVSGYIGLKYNISPAVLRLQDPPMGALPFYNNGASEEIRRAELSLAFGGLLKHLEELGVPRESGHTAAGALKELVEVGIVEANRSAKIVAVVDENYKFVDE